MRVEPELPNHPKFIRLKRRVGDYAMEALIRLWAHCQANQRGEFWRGADAEYLELIAAWDGEPGLLFRSLTDPAIAFVTVEETGLLIHDWEEMNGQIVSNWKKGPKGGRPRNPNRTGSINPTLTPGLRLESEVPDPGYSAISTDPSENPRVSHGFESANPTLTQCKPQQRNVTKRNETEEGVQGEGGLRYDLAQEAISFLNAQTGADFTGTPLELNLAAQCLARVGQDLAGVKKMIARQTALWTDVPRLRSCLQPRTLFEPEKFDGYYAQRELPATTTDPATRRKELEALIAKSPANRESVFHRQDVEASERDQLKQWKRELQSLQKNFAAEAAA